MTDLGPYGVIHRRLWGRPDFRALTFEARALFCYLRTCPAGGLVGIFRFHTDDAVEDLGMPAKKVGTALDELERCSFIRTNGRWLWVIDALETTPGVTLKNGKHCTAVMKALREVPAALAEVFADVYSVRTLTERLADSLPDTLSEASPNAFPNHVDVDVSVTGALDGTGNGDARIDERSGGSARAQERATCDEEGCETEVTYLGTGVSLCEDHSGRLA